MEIFFFLVALMLIVNWGLNYIQKQNDHQKEIDKFMQDKKTASHENILNVNNNVHSANNNILSERITFFLKNNNLKYWISEDLKTIKLGFNLENDEVVDLNIYLFEGYLEFSAPIWVEVDDESVSRAIEIITRLNQYFNFGHINFYFESRSIFFHNTFLFEKNHISESVFLAYLDYTINGVKQCRPLIQKVVVEKEEPVLAMMGLETNS